MTGRVRLARLTDLGALGELSRLAQTDKVSARSLGLPVSGSRIGVFSLFRLPLAAFRPNDLLFVYEDGGHVTGLLRAEREGFREDWTIVELDATGSGDSGDTRFRLVQHLLRDGARRGVARFHVACADGQGNVELFMQAGFARYGQEMLMFRRHENPLPETWTAQRARSGGIRPSQPSDAWSLSRLYASVTPPPVARLEAYRAADWERQDGSSRVPRSSLAPILRFAELESYIQTSPAGPGELSGMVQVGVAREDQPHYLRVMAGPDCDAGALIDFGLGLIGGRIGRGGNCPDNGILVPVRTYESPIDRRLEEAGFANLAVVTLLMKESMARVREPVLVPAVR